MSISRERMSSDVHHELLGKIIRGEFASGQRLRDAELAERLGVSRTPVREALLRLDREGFISAQKHLGFTVKPLEESEIREVYPLVRLLECTALEKAPYPDEEKLEALRDLGQDLKKNDEDALERIVLDSTWHKSLLEKADNRHLARIIADLKRILFRYEYAFMQVAELVTESILEHDAILDALEARDRRKAVRLLGAHWERCTQATLEDFLARRAEADSTVARGISKV